MSFIKFAPIMHYFRYNEAFLLTENNVILEPGAAAPDFFRRRQPAFGGALAALRRAKIFAAAAAASYNFGGEFGASNNYLIIKNLSV